MHCCTHPVAFSYLIRFVKQNLNFLYCTRYGKSYQQYSAASANSPLSFSVQRPFVFAFDKVLYVHRTVFLDANIFGYSFVSKFHICHTAQYSAAPANRPICFSVRRPFVFAFEQDSVMVVIPVWCINPI